MSAHQVSAAEHTKNEREITSLAVSGDRDPKDQARCGISFNPLPRTWPQPAWETVTEFRVDGEPKGMPRVKATIVAPNSDKRFIQFYNPPDADAWKTMIQLRAKPYRPRVPLSGPLRVWIDVFFDRPKELQGHKYPHYPIPHGIHLEGGKKPDRDNLDKAMLDALTVIEFWQDDAQVVGGEVCKWYCAKDGKPGASFIIERLSVPAGDLFSMEAPA